MDAFEPDTNANEQKTRSPKIRNVDHVVSKTHSTIQRLAKKMLILQTQLELFKILLQIMMTKTPKMIQKLPKVKT